MEHHSEPTRPNPLLFPIIMKTTISLLDFHSLKRCRLVSKLWEEEANKFLHLKKFPLTLSTSFDLNSITRFLNINYIIIPPDIGPDFFKITENVICHLHTSNCSVKYLELQNAGWSLIQLIKIIYSLPKLEQLTLSENFVLSKVDHSSTRLFQIFPKLKCTSLQSLQLNLRDENLQNLANIEFLFELYGMLPNLEKIKCWSNLFTERAKSTTTIFSNLLFRSIIESVSLNQCRRITSLDINLDLRNEDIELLQMACLPLKTLHLPLDIMISSEKVDNLLRSLKGTLKRLKLTHRNCIRSAPLFENIINLEYLALHGYDLELRCDPRRSEWAYSLDQTVFYMCNIVPSNIFPSFLDNFENRLGKLKEIHLNSVYFMSNDIFNFKTLFPNLSRVNVSFLDDEMIRSVFINFPRLESLTVKDGQFTDSGITGISHDVQEILQNGITNHLACGRLMEFPNISSLKHLLSLELASPQLTDFGVINGVALCQCVQELELNCPKIQDQSVTTLVENMKLDILRIKSGTFSKNVIETTRLKMAGGTFRFYLLNQLIS